MTKANYIQWLEKEIVKAQRLGGMELKIRTLRQSLKKARELGQELPIHNVNTSAKLREALETIRDAFYTDGETDEEKVEDLKAIAFNVLYEIDNNGIKQFKDHYNENTNSL